MKYISVLLSIIALLGLVSSAPAYKTVQFVSEFGGKGEALGRFSDKTRFAFDRDDNIYVVDTDNLRVQKLNPDGRPIMEISGTNGFLFRRPMDLAVDADLNIYVVDWGAIHIRDTESPRLFNYGPCVHKFSREGKFTATFTLEDLSQKAAEKEKALPAVDTDGNFALMIMPEKTDRQLRIAADSSGNIYILDQDMVYRLGPSGEVVSSFAEPGGGPGQLDKATDIAVDAEGSVYVADTGNHRVSKFSSDGDFLLSFGREGDTDGRFTGELYITAARDGTILVADSAEYEKILKTSIQHRKLIDSTILVTGQDDPLIPRRRYYETTIRRVQVFDKNGSFREKILYRIDRSDPELRDMEFKAIDPGGYLYLVDKDRLVMRKYITRTPLRWSEVEKILSCRVQYSQSRSQIDNLYNLNSYFDFDERERYTLMSAIVRLKYHVTETFSTSFTSSLLSLNAKTYDYYPGEYADPRGFIQDDRTTDSYLAAQVRLDFSIILDHDLFRYRVGDLFLYLGGGRYDFQIEATDVQNRRELDEHLWWNVWAAGVRYDMGSSLRFSLVAAHHRPPGFMNYEYQYLDENGDLYGTGFGSGASTEVLISVDGAF